MADEALVRIEAVTPRAGAQAIHVVQIQSPTLVDGPGLDELKQRTDALRSAQSGIDLLVDLEGVRMLSSAAIGLLGMMHRQTWGAKGRMKLCNVSPDVMKVFKLTRLDSVFDLYPTRDEALKSF
jgi:anti-anti-sigma factor